MSQKCIKMGFRADSSSTIVIDDDKMRDRSPSAGVELGWTRSKSPKTFGPVNNVVSTLATNLFISSTITYRGENCVASMKRIFKRLCHVKDEQVINLKGTTVVSDRGYNNNEYQMNMAKHAQFLNTVKRGPSLCFKFGSTSYKTNYHAS